MVAFRELWGNAYAIIHRNERSGRPAKYEIRHPMYIQPFRDEGEIYYRDVESGKTYSSLEMIHLRNFSTDGLEGKSTIRLMSETIRSGVSTDRFQSKFWQNGTNLSGWIEHPNIVKDEGDRKRIIEAWEKRYSGPTNAGKTGMLMGGAKYHPITKPLQESQFIETKRFSVEEIARIFNVPLLGS